MTSANWMERKWHHQKRKPREKHVKEKKTSRQAAGKRKGCRDSAVTSANQMERKWHHQKRKPREKHAKNMSSTKRRPDKQEATGKAVEIQN